jgi:hypothetical protein
LYMEVDYKLDCFSWSRFYQFLIDMLVYKILHEWAVYKTMACFDNILLIFVQINFNGLSACILAN